jgi:hypothetical protein
MTIAEGLAFLDGLPREQQSAFLGLFAGARQNMTSYAGACPSFGKSECQIGDSWRDFYETKLATAGLVTFKMEEGGTAIGMIGHPTYYNVTIAPTDLGWHVRDFWWRRMHDRISAEGKTQ